MKKIIRHIPVIAVLFSLVFTTPTHADPKPKRHRPAPAVDSDISSGNMTNHQLFRLQGNMTNGQFFRLQGTMPDFKSHWHRLSLTEDLNIPSGNMTNDQLFWLHGIDGIAYPPPPPPQGVPIIILESPEDGIQRAKAGDPVIVEGRTDDQWLKEATLLLNRVPIPIKVKEGHFKLEILLPETRVTTFRIMARGRNGQTGYSSLHTVFIEPAPR